jgi:hypothetical protein
MFVRLKTGAYAGEIREFPFVTGRNLVESGRAEEYRFGPQTAEVKNRVAPVANIPKVTAPAKKKKGKR